MVRVELEPHVGPHDAWSEPAQPDVPGHPAGRKRRRRAEDPAATTLLARHVDVEPADQPLEVTERGRRPGTRPATTARAERWDRIDDTRLRSLCRIEPSSAVGVGLPVAVIGASDHRTGSDVYPVRR